MAKRTRTTTRRRSPIAASALLIGALAATAGCGAAHHGGASGPGSSGPSTSRPAGHRTTRSGAAGSDSTRARAASASGAGPGRCSAAHLRLSLGRVESAAGSRYAPLVFRNTGSSTCSLVGFPGVSLLDGSGHRIGAPATRTGSSPAAVTLAPGHPAYAALRTRNQGVSDTPCRRMPAGIRAYPPDSTHALTTSAGNFRVCGGEFEVSVVHHGSHP